MSSRVFPWDAATAERTSAAAIQRKTPSPRNTAQVHPEPVQPVQITVGPLKESMIISLSDEGYTAEQIAGHVCGAPIEQIQAIIEANSAEPEREAPPSVQRTQAKAKVVTGAVVEAASASELEAKEREVEIARLADGFQLDPAQDADAILDAVIKRLRHIEESYCDPASFELMRSPHRLGTTSMELHSWRSLVKTQGEDEEGEFWYVEDPHKNGTFEVEEADEEIIEGGETVYLRCFVIPPQPDTVLRNTIQTYAAEKLKRIAWAMERLYAAGEADRISSLDGPCSECLDTLQDPLDTLAIYERLITVCITHGDITRARKLLARMETLLEGDTVTASSTAEWAPKVAALKEGYSEMIGHYTTHYAKAPGFVQAFLLSTLEAEITRPGISESETANLSPALAGIYQRAAEQKRSEGWLAFAEWVKGRPSIEDLGIQALHVVWRSDIEDALGPDVFAPTEEELATEEARITAIQEKAARKIQGMLSIRRLRQVISESAFMHRARVFLDKHPDIEGFPKPSPLLLDQSDITSTTFQKAVSLASKLGLNQEEDDNILRILVFLLFESLRDVPFLESRPIQVDFSGAIPTVELANGSLMKFIAQLQTHNWYCWMNTESTEDVTTHWVSSETENCMRLITRIYDDRSSGTAPYRANAQAQVQSSRHEVLDFHVNYAAFTIRRAYRIWKQRVSEAAEAATLQSMWAQYPSISGIPEDLQISDDSIRQDPQFQAAAAQLSKVAPGSPQSDIQVVKVLLLQLWRASHDLLEEDVDVPNWGGIPSIDITDHIIYKSDMLVIREASGDEYLFDEKHGCTSWLDELSSDLLRLVLKIKNLG